MDYPKSEIEELKRYCSKLSALTEGSVTYFHLEGLHLPAGCVPETCDALLSPTEAGSNGYPSRLYLSAQITSPYTRNWNVTKARIGEKNWFAFSWKAELTRPTLVQILLAHLTGFTKEK